MATAAPALAIPRPPAEVETVLKRVASAVVLVPLFAWVVAGAPAWLFQAVVVLAAGVAAWELGRLFDRARHPVYQVLGAGGSAAVTASFAVPSGGIVPEYPVIVLAAVVAAVVSAPVWSVVPPASDPPAYTVLSVVYVGWLLGFALLLHDFANGPRLLLFLAGLTWAGESAAYLVGSAIGRRRLAPVLSPGKTVEGATAQLVASIVAAVLIGPWLLPDCSPVVVVGAGGMLGAVGQVGDLAESALKRSVGAKDAGELIPGHGGLLDRIDSLLFNVPAFYVYALATGCAK